MKSLERRFRARAINDHDHSSLNHFYGAVIGQGFSRKVIEYWFNRLVDKEDYAKSSKKELLADLKRVTKPAEAGTKSGVTRA